MGLNEEGTWGRNVDPIMCLLEGKRGWMGDARKNMCLSHNEHRHLQSPEKHPIQLTAIPSASAALQTSHGCDVPNCHWHETDHVKNNCVSTVASNICYTTLLSVNCGYDPCWVSGVVLAVVAREQLCCSAADGTVTFPAGDPEHLNSGWRRKFSFTRESGSRIKEPIGSSHHSWAPMQRKHPRCGFLDKY